LLQAWLFAMPPAARITDMHTCPLVNPGPVPHVGGPIVPPCCPTVLIGGLPAARVGDTAICTGPPDTIVKGSATVFIGGMPAARIGDPTAHGGVIVSGWPTVIIGDFPGAAGGAGAGGAAAGAGPASNGPFASPDEAARAALNKANPQSITDNTEYSGLIYRGTDGKYYFSGPAKGTDQGANPLRDAPAPAGTTVAADYHTHGDYSTLDPVTHAAVRTNDPSKDQFNSDNFSRQDKIDNVRQGYPGYLGTPSGTYRKFDPATGADTVI
jgi:uncharacterized Zn-binding protein involved in type VI secretion